MPSYYSYKEEYPSALKNPNPPPEIEWEDTKDWPQTYTYIAPNTGHYQGYHPPAPVYQSNQSAMSPYHYSQMAMGPTPYYAHGSYYAQPQAPAPGWPYSLLNSMSPPSSHHFPINIPLPHTTYSNHYPSYYPTAYQSYPSHQSYQQYQPGYGYPTGAYASNWSSLLQASAAAAAANAAWSQRPSAPAYFVGATQADVDFQNRVIAQSTGAMQPSQLAPYKPAAGQQFWCKEKDGSWTLRTHAEVTMGEVSPGHWEKHATSGYFYWVRH